MTRTLSEAAKAAPKCLLAAFKRLRSNFEPEIKHPSWSDHDWPSKTIGICANLLICQWSDGGNNSTTGPDMAARAGNA